MKNCVYSHLETSGNGPPGQKTSKTRFDFFLNPIRWVLVKQPKHNKSTFLKDINSLPVVIGGFWSTSGVLELLKRVCAKKNRILVKQTNENN